MSKKRRKLIKSKTVIENPFDIETVTKKKGDSTEDTNTSFHNSGPTALKVSSPKKDVKKEMTNNIKNKTPKTKKIVTKSEVSSLNKAKQDQDFEKEIESLSKLYPFKVGEKIEYRVKYFALEAGYFTFEVKPPKVIQGRPVFHFYISARTSSIFAWVYTLKDFAESFWDMKLKRPYLMKIYGEESRYIREVQTAFDWKKKEARYQAKIYEVGKGLDEEDKKWSLNYPEAQDIVSALYFLRTKKLAVGKTFDFHVAEKGKDILVRAKVTKEKLLNTKLGKFMTYEVQPKFSVDGAWKQKGDITIWLTKDEHQTPIQFEAKIKVGTIRGRLNSLTH